MQRAWCSSHLQSQGMWFSLVPAAASEIHPCVPAEAMLPTGWSLPAPEDGRDPEAGLFLGMQVLLQSSGAQGLLTPSPALLELQCSLGFQATALPLSLLHLGQCISIWRIPHPCPGPLLSLTGRYLHTFPACLSLSWHLEDTDVNTWTIIIDIWK